MGGMLMLCTVPFYKSRGVSLSVPHEQSAWAPWSLRLCSNLLRSIAFPGQFGCKEGRKSLDEYACSCRFEDNIAPNWSKKPNLEIMRRRLLLQHCMHIYLAEAEFSWGKNGLLTILQLPSLAAATLCTPVKSSLERLAHRLLKSHRGYNMRI